MIGRLCKLGPMAAVHKSSSTLPVVSEHAIILSYLKHLHRVGNIP